MTNKQIIQRALPLNVKYFLVGTTYQSIEDGGGCSCDNCGKLITNVATIRNESGNSYAIGLDCLDTILENTKLLDNESYFKYQYSDKPAIAKAKSLRAKILKNLKKDASFKAKLYDPADKDYFGFSFSVTKIKNYRYNEVTKELDKVEPYEFKEPAGFDYTFSSEYKELTLNYIKGLPCVTL